MTTLACVKRKVSSQGSLANGKARGRLIVAEAQSGSDVKPDRLLNDHGWLILVIVEDKRKRSSQARPNVTMPVVEVSHVLD
jgi:hypothetical protein